MQQELSQFRDKFKIIMKGAGGHSEAEDHATESGSLKEQINDLKEENQDLHVGVCFSWS